MTKTKSAGGLSIGRKMAYGAAELNVGLAFIAINSWLLYFFVNIAAIPPFLAGIAFLTGRLFDAVMDPVIGRWSDRMRHAVGRKPAIKWALLPGALSYVAIWALPVLVDGTAAKFVLATLGFMTFSLFFTMISIPRLALVPDLEPTYHGRTKLLSVNFMFNFLAVLIAIAVTPGLVLALGQATDLAASPASAWITVATVFAAVGAVSLVPFLWAIPDAKTGANALPSKPFWAEVKSLFRTPGYTRIVLILLLSVLGTLIVQSMVPFYLESVIGVPGPAQGPILGAIFLLSILSFPLWAFVGGKIGKHRGLIAGFVVYGVFLAMIPFIPRDGVTPTLMIAAAISGIGISAINLFPWAMLPDAVDMDAQTHGAKREGLVSSVFVFAQKIAGSLAIFWNAMMLSVFDHQAGQVVQSEGTLTAFVWMTGPIPLAIFLVAMVLTFGYPITRAVQQGLRTNTAQPQDGEA